MTIFISIASYRDVELPLTIASALDNAASPSEIHIGVVQQSTKRERIDFSTNSQVSEIWMPPQEARGAGYARARAQELYRGEDYFMQIDSHTRFDPNWDAELIKMHDLALNSANTNKVIISAFPKAYIREGSQDVPVISAAYPVEPHTQIALWSKNTVWSALRLPFDNPRMTTPEESEVVLAGYIFTTGNIVSEVPYDQDISFFGEELCFSIRAWTRGWKIYSPNKAVLSHFYHRPGHNKIWDMGNNLNKRWGGIEKKSMDRQYDIYRGRFNGTIWGALDQESLDAYYAFIRQDVPSLYGEMLRGREQESKSHKVAELTIEGFTPMLSIPCMDEEHQKCGVDGCECPCHT